MIEALLFFLLLFPVWWLAIGHRLKCTGARQAVVLGLIAAGGVLGFLVAFACNGGAGGSSELSASAWKCLAVYFAIYHAILAFIVISGRRNRKPAENG